MIKKKLLFVEDNIVAAEAIKSFLSTRCSELSVVNTAEDAYELFLKDGHDLIITDLYLPKMDGFGLLQKIKEVNPQTTVFLISAHNTPENIKMAKELGAARFFPKPLNLDKLEVAVKEALICPH